MTKKEMTDSGRTNGEAWAKESVTDAMLRDDPNLIKVAASEYVFKFGPTQKSYEPYREAFVNAAVGSCNLRRYELPDRKAAYVLNRITRKFDSEIESAKAHITKILTKLADTLHAENGDVSYEVRWHGEDLAKASVNLQIWRELKAAFDRKLNDENFDRENITVESAPLVSETVKMLVDHARHEVMREARSRSHSTSFMSNEIDAMKVAVYAEFVEASTYAFVI